MFVGVGCSFVFFTKTWWNENRKGKRVEVWKKMSSHGKLQEVLQRQMGWLRRCFRWVQKVVCTFFFYLARGSFHGSWLILRGKKGFESTHHRTYLLIVGLWILYRSLVVWTWRSGSFDSCTRTRPATCPLGLRKSHSPPPKCHCSVDDTADGARSIHDLQQQRLPSKYMHQSPLSRSCTLSWRFDFKFR